MKQDSEPRRSPWERVYSALLLLYPRSFRRRFGQGMRYAFTRQLDDARGMGRGTAAGFWLRTFLHALGLGLLERTGSLWRMVSRRGSPGYAPPPGTTECVVLLHRTLATRAVVTIDTLWTDFRLALRRLRKNPRFTLVALLTLALGIGANSALFSVVNSVLLSPLPFQDSEQLVFAWETRDEGSRQSRVSPSIFEGWRDGNANLESMAAFRSWPFNVTGDRAPELVNGFQSSPGLLRLLRVNPQLGREFTPEEERPGAHRVCMVSHAYWTQRFGQDPDLGDLILVLNGEPHSVVGVLPEGFEIPGFGAVSIMAPLLLDPDDGNYWGNHNTLVIGRLRSHASLERADEELAGISSRLEEAYPRWNEGIGARVTSAHETLIQGARRNLWVLLGAVAFVLLIACVNIASLILARATAAQQEMAVRIALGAHRSRLVRMVLSEALVLSTVGGILGLGVCYFGVDAIRSWGPSDLPRLAEIAVSLPVLGFTMACAIGTGLLFGLAPALLTSKVDIHAALKEGDRRAGVGSRHRLQRLFVVSEVALSLILLVGSGLLLRSLTNILDVDPGFVTEDRVALSVALPRLRYPDRESVTAFLDELHAQIDAIPGVRTSGSSVGLPFVPRNWRKHLTVEGRPARTRPEIPVVDLSIVTPEYLGAMGISLLRGRPLEESDVAETSFVALVNEVLVEAHFPGEDPIGKRLCLCTPDHLLPPEARGSSPWYTIVGVVGNVRRRSLEAEALPEVFISQRQDTDGAPSFFMVAQTSLPLAEIADPMRRAVWAVDSEQPVEWVRTLDQMYSDTLSRPRFNAALVSVFGLSALILSVIGIYGLVANAVSTRTQEIGLRMALGARPREVLKQVAGHGVLASLGGVVLGLLLSVGLTRLMGSLLYGIEPLDPATYLMVALTVLCVVAAAATVPSWRAAKLDPTVALREE